MANAPRHGLLQYLRRALGQDRAPDGTDGQLLERFVAAREEEAFTALLERHGPLVWGVCRRVLGETADAEDAFQATFLVLVRKAGSVRKRESVRSWLYGIAFRVAVRARRQRSRRRAQESHVPDVPGADPRREADWRDLRPVLDEEIARLPEKYRLPLILCYLEGKTNAQAAQQVGCPRETLATRLARGREQLRHRLTRRGLGLSAALLTTLLSGNTAPAAVPPALAGLTLQAALTGAAGTAALTAAVISARVAALTRGVLTTMWLTKLKVGVALFLAVVFLGAGVGGLAYRVRGARAARGEKKTNDAEKDRQMLARLEEARLQKAQVKDSHFDVTGADRVYAAAFRAYGIDVEKLEPAEAAAQVRTKAIRVELAAALDDWALVRRALGKGKSSGWQRLLAVARTADPDPWRNRLRDALAKRDKQALRKLAAAAELSKVPASTVVLLADALAGTGAVAEAVEVLRQAQRHHPADFWINHQLASYLLLLRPSRSDEAVRFYTAALAVQPKSPGVHLNLGNALLQKGQFAEAVASFRQAIRLQPNFTAAYVNLGAALTRQGKLDEAVACYRKAITLQPDQASARLGLGDALRSMGRLAEAVALYRSVIALDPRNASPYLNLGAALAAQGKLDEAIACYRKAIELDPRLTQAHNNLGIAMYQKGRLDEAIACFQKALALDPKLALAHTNLGNALYAKGQLDRAIACFQKALALDPKHALAHTNLGNALSRKGQLDEAIACYRKAIELDPRFARAHTNLGNALQKKGKLDEAIACYRKALQLDPRDAQAMAALKAALRAKGGDK
jgi:RNA polymerase sigma factor (sigma-70 family)